MLSIQKATTEEDILKCWLVIHELRPNLIAPEFLSIIKEMMTEGYQLAFIAENNIAVAAIGYRYLNFLFIGKHFYIDDLSTLPQARGNGYASALLDYVAAEARANGFKVITLDSGHHRSAAHRLYLNKGFTISSHHFTKKIE